MNKRNEELNQQALAMLAAKEMKTVIDSSRKEEAKTTPAQPKTNAPPAQKTQAPKMSKEEIETAKKLYEEEQESLAQAISESQA
jgi:hypothetical protein